MPFEAATCLTYTASTELGPTLYFYSNVDGYAEPPFGSVPTTDITLPNCPYVISNVPEGTTIIRLRDYVSGCCIDIPIESNNICSICNLSFDVLETTTVSQIVAGNLDSTCIPNVDDYVVYWYGPNSTTEVGYTSGVGNSFPYQYEHPLTGSSAIFAQAGTYIPIIDKVIVDGISFSQTATTGYYPASLNCFPSVNVGALKCNNGNQPEDDYSHFFQFSAQGFGVTPTALSATFELSSNTKYFPFKFRADSITDKLKITLFSVNYDVPIVLEDIILGNSASGSFVTFPRAYPTSGYFGRVLTLTGFTITEGDYLILEVSPNTANTETDWYFGCGCKPSFSCDTCLDNYLSSPYPILSGSVITNADACDVVDIQFDVSGCTSDEIFNTDLYKYLASISPGNIGQVACDNTTKRLTLYANDLYYTSTVCSLGGGASSTCSPPNGSTITYLKTISGGIGNFRVTCSNYTDFLDFWDTYNSVYNANFGTPSDPSNIQYYRSFVVLVPNPVAGNCGDGTTFDRYDFHYSSVVTSGGTGPWYVNFTMPTMLNTYSFTSCDLNCQLYRNIVVNEVNNSSTGTSNNINATSTGGNRAATPISNYRTLVVNTDENTGSTRSGSISIRNYQSETIGWTGETNTLVPEYSGSTCTFTNWGYYNNYYVKYSFVYQIRLINPSNPEDFEVWGSVITNSVYDGYPSDVNYTLALRYQSGSVTYADPYFVK